MRESLDSAESRASFTNAGSCSELQHFSEPAWFGHLCHQLWPTKPWLMLMQRAGIKERTAHNYADGTYPPSAAVMVALLRSVEGYRVLKALLEPDSPEWWLVLQREVQLAALARDIFDRVGEVMKQ